MVYERTKTAVVFENKYPLSKRQERNWLVSGKQIIPKKSSVVYQRKTDEKFGIIALT
jgi:hypothetical protein